MAIQFAPPTVEQFFRTYRITTFAVERDERRLIFSTNMNGKPDLWALDLDRRYPFPYPLTSLGQNCGGILPDPHGRWLLAALDRDGDENWQVYALPPAGGQQVPVLHAPGQKFFPMHVSEDGRWLYYTTSQGNPVFLNSRRLDLETGADELLHEGAGGTTLLVAVSPAGDAFVTVESYSNTNNRAYLHRDGRRVPLFRTDAPHSTFGAELTDGDTVYLLTDEGEDVHYLARYDARTGQFTRLVHIEGEDMSGLRLHREGNALYILAVKGVGDRLYRYDIASGALEQIPLPYDTIDDFRVGKSGTLYVLGRSAHLPFNISLKRPGGGWEQLTDNRVFGVSASELRDAEVVRYRSFDGLEIEALLFRPLPERANGYTVVWPHGGPQWAERKAYRSLFQALLAAGYVVFAPNFRGSVGYGTRFLKMVERDWGHGPRLDMVAGVEWLIEQGIAHRDKIFLVGGSYGGYMTLLLHGRHPDYWRACVDIFGPSNLFTFINSVPDFWRPMIEQLVGHPERDKEKLTEDSPITYLKHMTKPMLIIQGANDPRVVKAESDQIVEALRAQGTPVEYMVLEDEGHGFSKLDNEIAVYRRILEFLARHQVEASQGAGGQG
ncbi:MAG: peptidase S9 [Firmicutes bacterium ZCTH02-B6]|nr:MAG: peptidase S9 [Firmicutes bacterium ZCTH02-B6]